MIYVATAASAMLTYYKFESLRQIREITRAWITRHDKGRPYHSAGKIRTAVFRRKDVNAINFSFGLTLGWETYGNTNL